MQVLGPAVGSTLVTLDKGKSLGEVAEANRVVPLVAAVVFKSTTVAFSLGYVAATVVLPQGLPADHSLAYVGCPLVSKSFRFFQTKPIDQTIVANISKHIKLPKEFEKETWFTPVGASVGLTIAHGQVYYQRWELILWHMKQMVLGDEDDAWNHHMSQLQALGSSEF